MIHICCPWKLSSFQNPPPPCPCTSKIFPPPWPSTSNSKPTPSLQMITSQLKENIFQGWLLYVIKSVLQVGFRFQYQLINLVWLSFDFFSFSWSLTICFFVALYSCVCSCPKISRNVFYLWLSTFLVLILQSICFICTIWKRKLWNNNCTVHLNESNQNKNKDKSRHVTFKLTPRCIVQISPQTMQWYH